jgi:hypothetical protein
MFAEQNRNPGTAGQGAVKVRNVAASETLGRIPNPICLRFCYQQYQRDLDVCTQQALSCRLQGNSPQFCDQQRVDCSLAAGVRLSQCRERCGIDPY